MLRRTLGNRHRAMVVGAALVVIVVVAVAVHGLRGTNQTAVTARTPAAASTGQRSPSTTVEGTNALDGVNVDALKTRLRSAVASLGVAKPERARVVQTRDDDMHTAVGMGQEPQSTNPIIIVMITGTFSQPSNPSGPKATNLVEMYKVPGLEPAGLVVGDGPGSFGDLTRFGRVTTLDLSS